MNPEPLPPDLRDLEEQLARRSCPEPAADFRARVLSAMANSRPIPVRAGRRWRFVWRAAAAVLLALNLGMSVANGIRFQGLNAPAAVPRPEVPLAFKVDDRFQALAASALATWT